MKFSVEGPHTENHTRQSTDSSQRWNKCENVNRDDIGKVKPGEAFQTFRSKPTPHIEACVEPNWDDDGNVNKAGDDRSHVDVGEIVKLISLEDAFTSLEPNCKL